MPYYIANQNQDDKGRHEVHKSTCHRLPEKKNQVEFGYYSNCTEAIRAIKTLNPSSEFDGCYYCCPNCHRG